MPANASATPSANRELVLTRIIDFEDMGGRTRYTAHALHWTEADRDTHEKMGFHEGWGKATDQLVQLMTNNPH